MKCEDKVDAQDRMRSDEADSAEARLRDQIADKDAQLADRNARVRFLEEQLHALQRASGTDAVPNSNTRVLRLIHNPSMTSLKRQQQQSYEPITPLQTIEQLRRELAHRTAAAAGAGAGAGDTSVSHSHSASMMMMSTAPMTMMTFGSPDTASSSSAAAASVSSSSSSGEAVDPNKLHQRLKEVFRERITSFREAVYLLTGYKVSIMMMNMSMLLCITSVSATMMMNMMMMKC